MKKGFTLLELLIVLGILAILTTVVVLVINPVQYLKEARDSSRLSDISTLSTALNHYQLTGASFGTESVNYVSLPSASSTCGDLGLPMLQTGWSYHCATQENYRNTNGTGWIPFDFSSVPGGSIIGSLPIDPINSTSSGLYYSFGVVNSKYEVWAQNLESTKFISKATDDGGISATAYEIGTDLTIAPHAAISASSTLSQTTDTDFNAGTLSGALVSGSGVSGSVVLDAYQYQVLNDGPTFYWKLDNDYTDAIGNASSGVATTTGVFGAAKFGATSASITGTTGGSGVGNGYINFPTHASLNFGSAVDFSIESWVKLSGNPSDPNYYIIYDRRTNGSGVGLVTYIKNASGVYTYRLTMAATTYISASFIPDTNWHHICWIADRDTSLTLYVDNVSQVVSGIPNQNTNDNTSQFTFGGRSYTQPSLVLNGLLDEVAVYRKLLTSTQVSNHYNAASAGTFISSVMDTTQSSTFSTMDYSATTNASTTLTMDIRAGNTATPDGTWTSWITGVANGGDISALGVNRYVQYKANFSTTDSSQAPILNDVTVNYSYYH